MSLHIAARREDVAPLVLLPGDPLRARQIASSLLAGAVEINARRNALGYTGTWRGARVTVQATGMGMPSMAIYAHELIVEYGARRLVRVGTCGALQPALGVGDLVLASAASTDSAMNRLAFHGMDFAPAADFGLLRAAAAAAEARGLRHRVGTVVTADRFYAPDEAWGIWAAHGVLAAEMETCALYTEAARGGVAALAILTVSDVISAAASAMSGDDRERLLLPAAELALEAALA